MPSLSGPQEEEHGVARQCLEVLAIVDLSSISFEDDPEGLGGSEPELFPAFPLKLFVGGDDQGLPDGAG
jgi:hypothetical protein